MMPLLFVGHGSPMNAIEENKFTQGWREIAKKIPTPKAILCVSAHWLTQGVKVTAMPHPRTLYDFRGFPQKLYTVVYPAPGNPSLAEQIANKITGEKIELDDQWGFDHGSWSVLKWMYPEAEIPILQISLNIYQPPAYHVYLAKQLRFLRDQGVLIVGSGNMVHNLGVIDFDKDSGYDWALESNTLIKQKIFDEDLPGLQSLPTFNAATRLAIPTLDHYLPLLYVMGLKEKNEPLSVFNDQVIMGSISMTSILVG